MVRPDPQGYDPTLRVVKQCKHQRVTRCITSVDFIGIFEYLTYSICKSILLALVAVKALNQNVKRIN